MRHTLNRNGDQVGFAVTEGDMERTGVALRYIVDAYPDEPLFCIRGRDRIALYAVKSYLGYAIPLLGIASPVIREVVADVSALTIWQRENVPLLKYPDR